MPSADDHEQQCYGQAKGHYRLVLMGAAAVGKTALVNQFLYDRFSPEYRPTVEELYRGEYDVGGGVGLVLDILDTSGSYQFPAMRRLAVSTGDAFVLVYAIDDDESFEEVGRLRELLAEQKGPGVPVVVVGNKSDLDKRRVVQRELADTIVGIDWESRHVEASAKDNLNVDRIFKEVLTQANFPYDLNPAGQKRRTSLPHLGKGHSVTSVASNGKSKQKFKRNSCAVS